MNSWNKKSSFTSNYDKDSPNNQTCPNNINNYSFIISNELVSPILLSYPKYKKPSCSTSSIGLIRMFGVNSYRGLIKKYNEDRVSIVLNIPKPQNFKGAYWPKHFSVFCLFDGHLGSGCCEFLRDNFHLYLAKSELFPKDIEGAIYDAFSKLENDFLSQFAIGPDNTLKDKSGSCALVTVIADKTVYIANIGDSRAIMSHNCGKTFVQLTEDHKPNLKSEKKRIKENDGVVYKVNSFNTLYRVLPGNLSVSRTIGDASSKVPFLGGKLGVIISTPEITKFTLDENIHDFILMGSDGIFDKLDNEDLIKSIWSTLDFKESFGNSIHSQAGICSDMAIKLAMYQKSKDNVSSIFIGFSNFEKFYLQKKGGLILKSKTIDTRNTSNNDTFVLEKLS